jgi:hypothetical protein
MSADAAADNSARARARAFIRERPKSGFTFFAAIPAAKTRGRRTEAENQSRRKVAITRNRDSGFTIYRHHPSPPPAAAAAAVSHPSLIAGSRSRAIPTDKGSGTDRFGAICAGRAHRKERIARIPKSIRNINRIHRISALYAKLSCALYAFPFVANQTVDLLRALVLRTGGGILAKSTRPDAKSNFIYMKRMEFIIAGENTRRTAAYN